MRLDSEGTTGDVLVPIERAGRWFLPPGSQSDELILVGVDAERGEVLWGCWLERGRVQRIMLTRDCQVELLEALATWDDEAEKEAITKIHMRISRWGY